VLPIQEALKLEKRIPLCKMLEADIALFQKRKAPAGGRQGLCESLCNGYFSSIILWLVSKEPAFIVYR
jgi:hypothetical protein